MSGIFIEPFRVNPRQAEYFLIYRGELQPVLYPHSDIHTIWPLFCVSGEHASISFLSWYVLKKCLSDLSFSLPQTYDGDPYFIGSFITHFVHTIKSSKSNFMNHVKKYKTIITFVLRIISLKVSLLILRSVFPITLFQNNKKKLRAFDSIKILFHSYPLFLWLLLKQKANLRFHKILNLVTASL